MVWPSTVSMECGLSAAAFTNLSRDHFDYHGSVADYLAAKRRLFSELLPPEGTAVLNADQPQFEPLAEVCRARGITVLDYGRAARRLRLIALEPRAVRSRPELRDRRPRASVETALSRRLSGEQPPGRARPAASLGCRAPRQRSGSSPVSKGRPGDCERVAVLPSGAPVFVDYAHTPDALATVLEAVRPHVGGRLVVVFGCGGDRDPGKRPEMGRIAAERADLVFVTDDNPRSRGSGGDPPGGRSRPARTPSRSATAVQAIRAALAELEAGDLLVIAGKGHETGQIVGERVLPFDDGLEVRRALAELGGAGA